MPEWPMHWWLPPDVCCTLQHCKDSVIYASPNNRHGEGNGALDTAKSSILHPSEVCNWQRADI